MPRNGPLSKQEKTFLEANALHLSTAQIAERLDRTEKQIQKNVDILKKRLKADSLAAEAAFKRDLAAGGDGTGSDGKLDPGTERTLEQEGAVIPTAEESFKIRDSLRATKKWGRLAQEFDPNEIEFFEEEYIGMVTQFQGNVLHTEEGQIFDAIKLEVLKSRNMAARKKLLAEIGQMEDMQRAYLKPFQSDKNPMKLEEEDRKHLLAMENQINSAKAREQEKTREWSALQERVEKIRASLKSNRDQRVKDVETKGQSFLETLKWLQNRDVQERKGREAELIKLAGKKEYERLGQPIKYDDGMIDSPILSCETLEMLDAQAPEAEDDLG